MALRDDLAPMLALDPLSWTGLRDAPLAEYEAEFGTARTAAEATLGAYPARRSVFATGAASGDLTVWSRDGLVVLVETSAQPDAAVLAALPPPDAELPGETERNEASVDEFLWLSRGLVLTIAEPLGTDDSADGADLSILRYRGIRPLASVRDYGAQYYMALDDREVFVAGGLHG